MTLRTRRLPPLLALPALALALGVAGVEPAAGSTRAHQTAGTRQHHGLTAKQRRSARRSLLRELRRNPRAVTRGSFARRAVLANFTLPLTVRFNPYTTLSNADCAALVPARDPGCALPVTSTAGGFANSDDAVTVDLGTAATADPPGVFAGVATADPRPAGQFIGFARFGIDTIGYGRPGLLELNFGTFDIQLPGFDLVKADATPPAGCLAGDTLLRTGPTVAVVSSPPGIARSTGVLDLLGGETALDLRTQWEFNSQRLDCATSTWFWTNRMLTALGDPPVTLQLRGKFALSPGFTLDHAMRLGKITIDTLAIPQDTTAALLHMCREATATTIASPPPTDPCDRTTGDLISLSRFTVKRLTAEVVLGTTFP